MRKSVYLVALVLAVTAGCVPPPPGGTNHIGGEGNLLVTMDGGPPFCALTGFVDIVLQDDTAIVTRTHATVTTLIPGVAPCDYNLFTVSSWLTCEVDPCGLMDLPMPHLEQATEIQYTTHTVDFEAIRFHLFGYYVGAPGSAYDSVLSPPIRCNPGGTECKFYP